MDDLEANKQLVRRFVADVFVDGRPDAIDELVADDFISHTWGINENGRQMLMASTERVHDSLEDVDFKVEELTAERDLVAIRLSSSAKPVGEFMGVPANGKRYAIQEMHFFRISDGRIAEHWHQHDALGMMRQLGALPSS